jgi:hypothetical protein
VPHEESVIIFLVSLEIRIAVRYQRELAGKIHNESGNSSNRKFDTSVSRRLSFQPKENRHSSEHKVVAAMIHPTCVKEFYKERVR